MESSPGSPFNLEEKQEDRELKLRRLREFRNYRREMTESGKVYCQALKDI